MALAPGKQQKHLYKGYAFTWQEKGLACTEDLFEYIPNVATGSMYYQLQHLNTVMFPNPVVMFSYPNHFTWEESDFYCTFDVLFSD